MAITAGRTAQGHPPECRARIEQKMLEDVTFEVAMRLEEAIRRKRARPDDESGRADVAMEAVSRNPSRPVQYGGPSSSWEVRPEPSRRESGRFSCQGVRRSWERLQRAPRCGCGRTVWMGPGLGGWSTGVLEDVACRASRVGDRIAAEAKAITWVKDEREAPLQGIKHLNFCCAVYRWQTERGVHFLREHPWRASSWDLDCLKAVRELPGVIVVRCDQRLCGL